MEIRKWLKDAGVNSVLSIPELKQELESLEKGSFEALDDFQLKGKMGQIHQGFQIRMPLLPRGRGIYRAVKVAERPSNKARISYPPVDRVTSNGRANRAGEVMFYGADPGAHQFGSCLQECRCQVGEFYAVSGWLTTEPMLFTHLGFSQKRLTALKSERELPHYTTYIFDERTEMLREWQARVFTQSVPDGREDLYRLPIALKEWAFGNGQPLSGMGPGAPTHISGIIYPSIAMWLLTDNVAILPNEVDSKMALFEVILLTVDSITKTGLPDGGTKTVFDIKPYDYARESDGGTLVWGQKSQVLRKFGQNLNLPVAPMVLAPD